MRALACALRVNGGTAWAEQRLSTSIADESAAEREAAQKLALADAMLERQAALESMLARCAEGAADWDAYIARVKAALPDEPAAAIVTLDGDRLNWVESDGTYAYSCSVVIHPLDAEHRSDFDGVPVQLDEEVFTD